MIGKAKQIVLEVQRKRISFVPTKKKKSFWKGEKIFPKIFLQRMSSSKVQINIEMHSHTFDVSLI